MTKLAGQALDLYFKKKTRVVFSAWAEMIASLHVLQRPDHHLQRLPWAEQVLAAMTPEQRAALLEGSRVTDEWLTLLSFETISPPLRSLEEQIEWLAQLPVAEFVWMLLNRVHPLSEVLEALHGHLRPAWVQQMNEAQSALLANPAVIRRGICEFLTDYLHAFFQEEWVRIEPWLVRAEKTFAEQWEQKPAETFANLHPRLFVKEDAIYAQKATLYRFPYTEVQTIFVRASTFMHPHLLIDWHGDVLSVPLAVNVAHVETSNTVPADLVRMFKAASDPTRLRIMRCLHAQPYCTQQLAHILAISEAAVSKHLKLLLEADFVETERRGNYMFYSLRGRDVEMMMVYLRQFLEQ